MFGPAVVLPERYSSCRAAYCKQKRSVLNISTKRHTSKQKSVSNADYNYGRQIAESLKLYGRQNGKDPHFFKEFKAIHKKISNELPDNIHLVNERIA